MAEMRVRKVGGTTEIREPKKVGPIMKERKVTSAELLAGDRFCKINFYPDGLKEAFPNRVEMWSVDKMYPYAKPNPLYVDEPHTKEDVEKCMKKVPLMKELGYRYVILKDGVEQIG